MFWRFLKGSQVDCIKVKEGVNPLSVGHQAGGQSHLRDRERCRRES